METVDHATRIHLASANDIIYIKSIENTPLSSAIQFVRVGAMIT
jgi:hypothetical protein